MTAITPMRVLTLDPRSFAALLRETAMSVKVLDRVVRRLRSADAVFAGHDDAPDDAAPGW